MLTMRHRLLENHASIDQIIKQAKDSLLASGFDSVEYIDVRHPLTLLPISAIDKEGGVILVAAILGKTRLIDNLVVEDNRLA